MALPPRFPSWPIFPMASRPPSRCRTLARKERHMDKTTPGMTCIIAEDETLLRDALVAMLGEVWPDLRILAVCDDGGTALDAIATLQPDVAFLDIRMPGLSGMEVAAGALDASPGTQVVFVTAYNQYAIEAFDRGAVDYLLKPLVPERLAATVQRLKSRIASGGVPPQALAAILEELRARPAAPSAPSSFA